MQIWMAFIMLVCVKNNLRNYCLFTVLWVFCLFLSPTSYADDYHARINNVKVSVVNDYYLVSAHFTYQLSPEALEALQNGVPLFWTIRIKAEQQVFFLANTLIEHNIHYQLRYHALLNMYRVNNEETGETFNFSQLANALASISHIKALPVIAQHAVSTPATTTIKIKILFNLDALPLPLRPFAHLNHQWSLSSNWTSWPLTK